MWGTTEGLGILLQGQYRIQQGLSTGVVISWKEQQEEKVTAGNQTVGDKAMQKN